VLAVLACTLAHEATYQLLYRGGDAYRTAMTLLGHDGYWMGLTLGVGVSVVALAGVAATQLLRLRDEASSTPALAADETPGLRSYLGLVGGTWLRLALLASLIYTAQENLESVTAGMSLRGLDVILAHGLLPLLVMLGATLLMALAIGLVRWRRRVLLGRLSTQDRAWSRPQARRPRPVAARATRTSDPSGAWSSRAPPLLTGSIAL
jgi:hypothetical protein